MTLFRAAPGLLAALLLACPVAAQDSTAALRQRLLTLSKPSQPPVPDAYADEIRADLARIGSHDTALFGPHRPFVGAKTSSAAIALFIGPDCGPCPEAIASLDALATRLGLRANLIDIADPENATLLQDLTLDIVPSYVMPDRLIRGVFPDFVLDRYLRSASR